MRGTPSAEPPVNPPSGANRSFIPHLMQLWSRNSQMSTIYAPKSDFIWLGIGRDTVGNRTPAVFDPPPGAEWYTVQHNRNRDTVHAICMQYMGSHCYRQYPQGGLLCRSSGVFLCAGVSFISTNLQHNTQVGSQHSCFSLA